MNTSETAVLDLLLGGRTSREIAGDLSLSPFTIDHVLRRLRQIHGVRTTRALIIKILTQQRDAVMGERDEYLADLEGLDRRRVRS